IPITLTAALYIAEVLNNNIFDGIRLNIPFIQVYIISCNNFSNTYEELGQLEKAESMLKRTMYYLIHRANNQLVNRNEIQSESKRDTLAYIAFLDKNKIENVNQDSILKDVQAQISQTDLMRVN
ncbi:tetratricopeptide repeat protein, partial [Arenibacter lacus]|uniref:tetratricopeptide repeat protein n=1 Tax=Arenibacter lacus TaxID=2608629 RepID=UPI00168B413C